jgi:putative hemolysin
MSVKSKNRDVIKPKIVSGFSGFSNLFEISDKRYKVKLAQTIEEIESALRLRFDVFNTELGNLKVVDNSVKMEFDQYDFSCKHLIVIETATNKTVGTYRLNSIETAKNIKGFYSFNEFSIEDLPADVWQYGIEIGRACIAPEHRNTKVLFILWKCLANYLKQTNKRYFFGCCSIFTNDLLIGETAFRQLEKGNYFHQTFRVTPRKDEIFLTQKDEKECEIELPNLFNMYLKIGAKVCGAPTVDREFGTIDFFVVFDLLTISEKYRKMFFGEEYRTKTLDSSSNLKFSSNIRIAEQFTA